MVPHQVMWLRLELIVGWPDQVLGNAELRARYDAHGAEALDVNFMDSAEFFTALFGSDRFDHLVGELMIAVAARSNGEFLQGQMKKLQARTATSPCYFACGGPAALCPSCVSLRGCSFPPESLTLHGLYGELGCRRHHARNPNVSGHCIPLVLWALLYDIKGPSSAGEKGKSRSTVPREWECVTR